MSLQHIVKQLSTFFSSNPADRITITPEMDAEAFTYEIGHFLVLSKKTIGK